jgi:hypothetical protein
VSRYAEWRRYEAQRAAMDRKYSEVGLSALSPPATAVDVAAVHRGEITGPEADAVLASYFAPGPEPRYDTPRAQAEAEAEAEL